MSIKVAVRVRPFNQRELDRGETEPVLKMVRNEPYIKQYLKTCF